MAPTDAIDFVIDSKLKAILQAGPEAAYQAKLLAQASPKSLEDSARLLAQARAGKEGGEGVAAFLDKRPASFAVQK